MTNIDELKSTGLKATVPRQKILEIFQFQKRNGPPQVDIRTSRVNA